MTEQGLHDEQAGTIGLPVITAFLKRCNQSE